MPEYSFLNLEQVAESQSQKEVTVNQAIEALAKGAGAIDVSVASGSVSLTEEQSHYGIIRLTGAPGASRVVTVDPDISRTILFVNATTGGQTIEVEQSGGTNFPVPAGGWVLLLSATQAITVQGHTAHERDIVDIAFVTNKQSITNMAAALQEFGNEMAHRRSYDLTNFTQARITLTLTVAGAATPAKVRAQYSINAGSSWDYLDGAAGPSVNINTTGHVVSSWVNLAAPARAEVWLRIVHLDGDAAADPNFGGIAVQFR